MLKFGGRPSPSVPPSYGGYSNIGITTKELVFSENISAMALNLPLFHPKISEIIIIAFEFCVDNAPTE
jgi:hypothetical protein